MRRVQEELIQDVAELRSLSDLLAPTPAFVISLFCGFLFIFIFKDNAVDVGIAFTHLRRFPVVLISFKAERSVVFGGGVLSA